MKPYSNIKKPNRKSELIAISRNRTKDKIADVYVVSRDGWVVTSKGAMADLGVDCDIFWAEQTNYLKNLRKEKNLTQQEMSWILGISRYTYIGREQGKQELTHKEWLITRIINENF